jgi:hypothetical protein
LYFAALGGHVEVIEFHYSLGLDVNQLSDNGSLPLHLAVRNGYKSVVDTLLKLGSVMDPDGYGMTPQAYAKKLGHATLQKSLEETTTCARNYAVSNTNQTYRMRSKSAMKALVKAILRGDLALCMGLQSQGYPLDGPIPSCGGCSPLIVAIKCEQEDIVRWLLEHHVSVLHVACHKHGGSSTLELAVKHQLSKQCLRKILDVCLATAWDLDSLGHLILTAVICRKCANLSTLIEHIKQNLERYR